MQPQQDGAAGPLIDLHCHILPGLDDGAIDIDDSVVMARQAEADGIDVVCATPHIRSDHDVRIAELRDRVTAVNSELERQRISTRVAIGGEIAEQQLDHLDDGHLRAVSLGGGGRWILLEPRPGPLSAHLADAVDRLADRGFSAVVAHPERHTGADFRERLEALVGRGALVQATSALVAEGPASATLLELGGRGLVHLLGSDAHSSHGGRRVELSRGLARLASVERLAPHGDWIAREGPAAILRGEPAWPPFAPG